MRRYLLQKSILPPIHSLPPCRVHRRYSNLPAPFRQDAEPRQFRLFPASAEALHHLQSLRRDFAHAPTFQRVQLLLGLREGWVRGVEACQQQHPAVAVVLPFQRRFVHRAGAVNRQVAALQAARCGQNRLRALVHADKAAAQRLRARRAAAGVPAVSAASASDSPCAPGLSAASG